MQFKSLDLPALLHGWLPDKAIDYALQYGRGMTPEQAGTFIGMYVNEDSLQLSDDLQEAIAIIKEQYV